MSVRRPPSRPERNRRISARGTQHTQRTQRTQGNHGTQANREDTAAKPRSGSMPARSAHSPARSAHSPARSASSPARAGAAYRSETTPRPGANPRPGAKPRPGTKPRQGSASRSEKTSRLGQGSSRTATQGRNGQRRAITVESGQRQHTVSLRAVAIALFAILAIIIVTPTVSRFSAQQHELRAVRAELESVQQHTRELEVEKALWNDPDYVRAQARVRLGYVVPGQRLFVGADPNEGTAQEQLEERVATVNRERRANTPWYVTGWDSITIAGNSVDGQLDNPDEAPMYTPPTPQPEGEAPEDAATPAPGIAPAPDTAPAPGTVPAADTDPAPDTAPAPEGE